MSTGPVHIHICGMASPDSTLYMCIVALLVCWTLLGGAIAAAGRVASKIPELTGKTSDSLCLKFGGVCMIYLKEGVLAEKELHMLSKLADKYTSKKHNQGAKMGF